MIKYLLFQALFLFVAVTVHSGPINEKWMSVNMGGARLCTESKNAVQEDGLLKLYLSGEESQCWHKWEGEYIWGSDHYCPYGPICAWPVVGAKVIARDLSFLYGTVEVRLKIPSDYDGLPTRDSWPSIWFLRKDICYEVYPTALYYDYDPGPGYGCKHAGSEYREVDFLEWFDNNNVHITLHRPGITPVYQTKILSTPTASTEFHTYKMIWEPGSIRWFMDDVEVECNFSSDYVPDMPLFMVIGNNARPVWTGYAFDTTDDRDAYFVANPESLTDGRWCYITYINEWQEYSTTTESWSETTARINANWPVSLDIDYINIWDSDGNLIFWDDFEDRTRITGQTTMRGNVRYRNGN